jgi:hypothetical protein
MPKVAHYVQNHVHYVLNQYIMYKTYTICTDVVYIFRTLVYVASLVQVLLNCRATAANRHEDIYRNPKQWGDRNHQKWSKCKPTLSIRSLSRRSTLKNGSTNMSKKVIRHEEGDECIIFSGVTRRRQKEFRRLLIFGTELRDSWKRETWQSGTTRFRIYV